MDEEFKDLLDPVKIEGDKGQYEIVVETQGDTIPSDEFTPSSNVLIDPSLLVAESTLESSVKKAGRRYDDLQFFVPQSFLDTVESNQDFRQNPVFRYFVGRVETPRYQRMVQLLDDFSDSIEGYTVSEGDVEGYRKVYEALSVELPYRSDRFIAGVEEPPYREGVPYRDNRDVLADIAFEEFVFLVEKSWIVSRTKRIFNSLNDAGATTVQFGKRTVEDARKQLGDQKDATVERLDELKDERDWQWVAIGGSISSSILGLHFPPAAAVAGASSGVIQAYIKLFDP